MSGPVAFIAPVLGAPVAPVPANGTVPGAPVAPVPANGPVLGAPVATLDDLFRVQTETLRVQTEALRYLTIIANVNVREDMLAVWMAVKSNVRDQVTGSLMVLGYIAFGGVIGALLIKK